MLFMRDRERVRGRERDGEIRKEKRDREKGGESKRKEQNVEGPWKERRENRRSCTSRIQATVVLASNVSASHVSPSRLEGSSKRVRTKSVSRTACKFAGSKFHIFSLANALGPQLIGLTNASSFFTPFCYFPFLIATIIFASYADISNSKFPQFFPENNEGNFIISTRPVIFRWNVHHNKSHFSFFFLLLFVIINFGFNLLMRIFSFWICTFEWNSIYCQF